MEANEAMESTEKTSSPRTGDGPMESWRNVWREGVAPLLSLESLGSLRQGLVDNVGRLLQGATTTPPPLQCVQDWPVEAACILRYCGWGGGGPRGGFGGEEEFART